MLKNFQKQKKFSNLNYCLNSEKEIAKFKSFMNKHNIKPGKIPIVRFVFEKT